jgi:hypothetical protein
MSQIPKTRKKLREAEFFLGQLSEKAKSLNLEPEKADFYLSAFLSAARSVTLFCQFEEKALYDTWFLFFQVGLSRPEEKLLCDMNKQRVAEVHQGGAGIRPKIESSPVTRFDVHANNPLASSMIGCDPPGIPPAEVGQRVLYFQLAGETVEVLATCKTYLSLLRRFVNDFEQRIAA